MINLKNTTKLLKAVTFAFAICGAASSYAQSLDLSKLHDGIYRGDDKHRKTNCVLDVGPAKRDSANRRVQTFEISSEGTDLDLGMLLSGGQNIRQADYTFPNNQAQFNITIEDKRLELICDGTDTTNVISYKVWQKSNSGGNDGLVLECTGVSKKNR